MNSCAICSPSEGIYRCLPDYISSVDIEVAGLGIKPFHFCPEDGDDVSKKILVCEEASREEAERILEELVVVFAVEDGRFNVADKVLEERADHDVDDLTYFQIHIGSQGGARVERLEILTASNVLLRSLLVQLVKCRVGEFFLIYGASEVEGNVVHKESNTHK